MAWISSRAEERIRRFRDDAPEIKVERYDEDYVSLIARQRDLARSMGQRASDSPPLFDLPSGAAVMVDTVQVYVRLLNYDDFRLEGGRETEASHARGLAVLHTLYSAADRVVEGAGGQRVDYHGARLHAVVIEPRGQASVAERIAAAIELAEQMMELARLGGRRFLGDLGARLRFRVGIDVGTCVAINSGRTDEREPMFVGSAANHAAKLVAGDEEGIYLSDRVRALFSMRRAASLNEERALTASTDELGALRSRALDEARAGVVEGRLASWIGEAGDRRWTALKPADFSFHHHLPPLRSIDYAKLSPGNSIRMPMAVLFADLDRYTAYIDRCMATGDLGVAVRLLHVLRSEMNAVVQQDFKGRKVRFIGDCILAILAEGDARSVDMRATVSEAVLCAGALRSSFDLCVEIMPEGRELGLQIGVETGETPVSRIGIRGERAVRVASSLAVRAAEQCQLGCDSSETRIGQNARANASPAVRSLFDRNGTAADLTYDDVAVGIDPRGVSGAVAGTPAVPKAPAILSGTAAAAAAAIATPARAYLAE